MSYMLIWPYSEAARTAAIAAMRMREARWRLIDKYESMFPWVDWDWSTWERFVSGPHISSNELQYLKERELLFKMYTEEISLVNQLYWAKKMSHDEWYNTHQTARSRVWKATLRAARRYAMPKRPT